MPGAPAPEASRLHSAALQQQSAAMDLLRLAQAIRRYACPAIARMRPTLAGGALAVLSALSAPDAALADKISNPTAVFNGLDKITGRIISFEVAINETVQFGALQITPRVCYSRPPTDAPQTDAFAQVDEIDELKQTKRIFWVGCSPTVQACTASSIRFSIFGSPPAKAARW